MNVIDILSLLENKQFEWNELAEDVQKSYSQFMINRFVSSKIQYVNVLAEVARYKMTNEQHYNLVKDLIAKQKHYFNYKAYKKAKVNSLDDLLIFAIKKELEVGKREAESYIEFLSETDIKEVKAKWKPIYDSL
jgi:hypothetical protein